MPTAKTIDLEHPEAHAALAASSIIPDIFKALQYLSLVAGIIGQIEAAEAAGQGTVEVPIKGVHVGKHDVWDLAISGTKRPPLPSPPA